MKCPKCGYDQKVKYGLKCGGCGYQFTFNPKESQTKGLTDGKFSGCIDAASQNGTSFFTRNQLYAVYSRRMSGSPAKQIGCGVAALAAAVGLAVTAVWPLAFVAAIVGVISLIVGIHAARQKVTPGQFDGLLKRWLADGKTIDRLVEQPGLHDPPPDWSEPDIYDYGVERILIVERDILVDLFVKNGVHAEQRMLVISESGYPNYLTPVARRLLSEQPDLPVFLLHDATARGATMKERVLAGGLPLDGHTVTDLGMFPADFQKLKRTKKFDPDNENRALPVDAMMLPFMTMGVGAAMAENMTLGSMIEQQRQRSASNGGYDFG